MNKSDLDSILKKARPPERPKEFWEEFPQQVARGLNPARTENHRDGRNWFPQLAWGFAMVICILTAFAIGLWRGQVETKASTDVLANVKVVGETLAMFPNQVRAIVQDGHGLKLVLSDSANVPASMPIYVRFCDGNRCTSFVTFSGQEIQIAGQKMTVLSDAQGGIILTGNQFVWSNADRVYADKHIKIEAKNIGLLTM